MTPTTLPLPDRPAGIMFHHFHGGDHPVSQGSISGEDLERMLAAVDTTRILPARVWQERAEAGTLAPGTLCLTFDDNLLCQYEIAVPVLRRHDLTAFFFVYTSVNQGAPERLEIYRHFRTVGFTNIDAFYDAFFDFLAARPESGDVSAALCGFDPARYLADYVYLSDSDRRFRFVRDRVLGRERYEDCMDRMLEAHGFDIGALLGRLWMTDAMLQDLHADGHVIGLHSHTHPTLIESLSPAAQRREYADNAAHLTAVLGEAPRAMSHPNNSYSAATLELLRELGIAVGFRANMARSERGPLEWPRHNHALIHRAVRERLR